MSLITGKDIQFSYESDQKKVLSALNFEVIEKQNLWLKGENGSGKTTFLKILCGILKPTGGVLKRHLQISDIGILFGKTGFKLSWSVSEIIKYFTSLTRATPREVKRAISLMGLESWMYRRAGELSLGWQKKLALTRVLMKPRQLYLLDEPFSSLDEEATLILVDELSTQVKKGSSLVYTSHGKVAGLSSQTWKVEKGHLL